MFNQLLINSIIAGSIYTLIALGFSLIYSTTKFFHFAHRELLSLWVGEFDGIEQTMDISGVAI